jgi:hypothetical protein
MFTLTIDNCTKSKQLTFATELELLWEMDCHATHFVEAGFRVEFNTDLDELGVDPPCTVLDTDGAVGCMYPGLVG